MIAPLSVTGPAGVGSSDMIRTGSLRTVFAAALAGALSGARPVAASPLDEIFGDAPIVRAARAGSVEDMNAALVAGESVTKRAADGTPVIVLATAARSLPVVKILI